MKQKLLIAYLIIEVVAIIALIILYAAFHVSGDTIGLLFLIVFLAVPIIALIIGVSTKKAQNSAKNHALVYASRSKELLDKSNISYTLFKDKEVNTNPKESDFEEETEIKANVIIDEIKKCAIGIIFSIIFIGIELFCRFGSTNLIIVELIAGVVTFFYLFYLLIFIIDTLTKKDEVILFSEDKVQAIKDFDEVDDSIQITDYKIYEEEMYITLPTENKCIYSLITRKKLVIVTLNNDQINTRDLMNKNEYGLKAFKEYKKLFNELKIEEYKIKNKDIIDVLKTVRESVLN